MTILAAVATACVFAGCSLDPTYQRPAAPMATHYDPSGGVAAVRGNSATAGASASASTSAVETEQTNRDQTSAPVLADWQQFILDPYLRQLIALTLDNNRDLRVAALQVAEYEAEYRIARSDLGPTLTATGSSSRSHSLGTTTGSSSVSLGTSSWEIDFFGRLRSLKRQALETYLSTDAARRSTQLSLVSTTATDYLAWLSDRTLLNVARKTVASDQQTYDTTLKAAQLGNEAMEDVQEARTTLSSAKSSLAAYERAVAQDRNNLIAAIGAPLPDGFPDDRTLDDVTPFAPVPAGLPSELLTRRPDIVEAEHALKAGNAYVGAARAAFFPTISLTASAGTTSSQLSQLFKAGTGAWAFAPTISTPLFSFGELKASLDVAKVEKDIYVADYEKAIQTAFKEVSNALAGRATYDDQLAADAEYVDAAQKYYDTALGRYHAGLDSFLTLLTAQRTLYTAQTQWVSDRLSQQENLVTLYTALGGGWSANARAEASPVQMTTGASKAP
ncbi:efflux transporter outer membrane subunit [Robbsia sp. KACC 23696]|uniref:efflux transporter outer membrane subunit n=1 Tax=Robbsia sp. KACC 23696 TaxID=3149231 RepID=UPI00325AA1E4